MFFFAIQNELSIKIKIIHMLLFLFIQHKAPAVAVEICHGSIYMYSHAHIHKDFICCYNYFLKINQHFFEPCSDGRPPGACDRIRKTGIARQGCWEWCENLMNSSTVLTYAITVVTQVSYMLLYKKLVQNWILECAYVRQVISQASW